MRRSITLILAASAAALAMAGTALAQHHPVDNRNAPIVPFDTDPNFFKLPAGMNWGETLGVAVNSKGHIVVLHHPGSATTGPIYGNATSQIFEFDGAGNFLREIGRGVYGLAYAHSVRFDRYDNLWVVDKATDSVMKFNPEGRVVLNLGRRDEGYDSATEIKRPTPSEAVPTEGRFKGPTDVGWDPADNIFVSDGYTNSRIAKFDKNGDYLTTWGANGPGGEHADENPGHFRNPHNLQLDRQGNVYVADRGNRRIQVFDSNGKFLRFLFLDAPYDKTHHPTLDPLPKDPSTRHDETEPWAICITNTPIQYLYAIDNEPGRLQKLTLDGKILAIVGMSGRQVGQFNWPHALACPSENVVFVADMNNWRMQKITLHPERVPPAR